MGAVPGGAEVEVAGGWSLGGGGEKGVENVIISFGAVQQQVGPRLVLQVRAMEGATTSTYPLVGKKIVTQPKHTALRLLWGIGFGVSAQ